MIYCKNTVKLRHCGRLLCQGRTLTGICKMCAIVVYYRTITIPIHSGFFCNMDSNKLLGQKLQLDLNSIPFKHRREVEEWIVNTVKIKLVRKFEAILEMEGKSNMRKLFLVPVFKITEMTERIKTTAPELLTVYFKELIGAIEEAGQRLS